MKAQVLTFLFLTNLFLCSCKTLQRNIEEDTYAIINMELERASKNKDSLFIIDWGKNYDLNNEEILQIKNDSNAIRHFIEFLDKQGINWNHEISFFEKQLKKPFKIDKKKISVDNALIIKNSEYREILDLEFNFDYTSKRTYLKLNRPVFTEDGINAIIYKSYKSSQNYFSLFKKVNGKWERTLDYFYPLPVFE